jgi:hypothetical protein
MAAFENREAPMDFHSLAAAHLPTVRRSRFTPLDEDRYYRSCRDLPALRLRALARVGTAAALVLLAVALVPA